MRNQKGFTLIEMLTATVVLSIFVSGISGMLAFFAIQKKTMVDLVSTEVDSMIGEHIVAVDLSGSSPSFNNMKVLDDNHLGLFDYYPDLGPTLYRGVTQRTLTLKVGGVQESYFITHDPSAGEPVLYDPVAAYQVGATPANFSTAARLNYASLNQNSALANLNPKLWMDGRILMLETTARLRNIDRTGAVDLLTLPRSPIYLGQIRGTQVTAVQSTAVRTDHPLFPTVTISTPDVFFRTAPPMNGSAPVVKVSGVQLVRYSIQRSAVSTGSTAFGDLYREVYDQGNFRNKQLIARNVASLVLNRPSIFQPLITFQLNLLRQGGNP